MKECQPITAIWHIKIVYLEYSTTTSYTQTHIHTSWSTTSKILRGGRPIGHNIKLYTDSKDIQHCTPHPGA